MLHNHEPLSEAQYYKGIDLQHTSNLKKGDIVYSFKNDRYYKIFSYSNSLRTYTVDILKEDLSSTGIYISIPMKYVHRMPFANCHTRKVT